MTFQRKVLAVAVASCFAGGAHALPTAPTVAAGGATFAQSGKTLTVTNTPGAVINWQSFSILQGEATRFVQQSAASAVLNRVTGGDPSVILGQLQSNGRVFLINPSGITFGAGAQIDVAGLVASSLHMADADFIAGRFKFAGNEQAGRVINQGEIRTPEGGRVWLVAPKVENSGLITTPQGEIILAAGKSIEITDPRNSALRVQIEAPEGEALNIGQLVAKSGSVGMYGRTVRVGGSINANAAVMENGKVVFRRGTITPDVTQTAGTIELKASDSLTVEAGVKISADGPKAGKISMQAKEQLSLSVDTEISANGVEGGSVEANVAAGTLLAAGNVEARGSDGPGGRVTLTGQRVGILPRTRIDASGETGGGVVLIGGDYQGKNPEVQNADSTYVGHDAEIRADALGSGDGGKVVVWADHTTRYYGTISARGGEKGGNGGIVEVSGKDTLVFKGSVDTRAPRGKTGSLLLDPANIIIANGSSDSTDDGADVSTTSFAGDPSGVTGTVVSGDNPGGGTLTLFESELEGIAAGTNVSLAATNAITINDLADNNLNLAQTGGGSVSFNSATFSMNAGDTITTAGAAINITTTGAMTAGGLNAAGGAITLDAGGVSSVNGVIAGPGSALAKSGAGTLTLGGVNTYTGASTINAGTLALNATGTIATSSGVANAGTFTTAAAKTIDSMSGNGNSVLTGILTIGDASNTTATYDGVISGTGGITKAGTGTLTLTGTNSYTGATTINAGTLSVSSLANGGANSNIGASTNAAANLVLGGGTLLYTGADVSTNRNFTLTAGTTSTVNVSVGANTLTMTGADTATTGGLTKAGAGTLVLTGANLHTGATTLSAGTLRAQTNAGALGAGTLVLNAGTTLELAADANTAFNRNTTVNGAVTIKSDRVTSGAGVTHTLGTLSIGAQTLNVTAGGNVSSGTAGVTFGATTLSATGSTFTSNASSLLTLGAVGGAGNSFTVNGAGNSTITGIIGTGSGSLTKDDAGTLTLAGVGANTYSGTTTVSGGTLNLNKTAGIDAIAGNLSITGGSVVLQANNQINNASNVVVNGGTLDVSTFSDTVNGVQILSGNINGTTGVLTSTTAYDLQVGTVSAILGGAAGVNKSGAGTVTLSGANTYTGATTVSAGQLTLGHATNTLADASTLVVSGGTLDLGGNADTVSGVQLTGGTIQNGTLTSTSAYDLQSGTVSAVLAGTVGANKTTAGTVTFSGTGANTYTGTTTVSAGTLNLNKTAGIDAIAGNLSITGGSVVLQASNQINNASNVVANGGTLDVSTFSDTVNGVQLLSGNINGTTGVLTSTTAFDLQSGTVSANLGGTAGANKSSGGTVTLSGSNSYTGATTVSAGQLTLSHATNTLADASTLVVSGGTLDLGGNADTVAGVQLTGGTIQNGTLTSTSAYDLQSGTVSAMLAGAVGANKTTAGTVTLSGTGANTYTGTTNVSGGTLNLNKTAGIDAIAGNLTITGGSVVLQANNQVNNASNVVVNGGTLDVSTFSDTVNGVQLLSGNINGTSGVLTSTTAFDLQSGTASAILGGRPARIRAAREQ